jgi:hypothetical protein
MERNFESHCTCFFQAQNAQEHRRRK